MGPDLTNAVQKGEGYVRSMIEYGNDRMPKLDLTAEEVSDVTEYLRYVNGTGESPLRSFRTRRDGTVERLGRAQPSQ
jgi:hypothetical protein